MGNERGACNQKAGKIIFHVIGDFLITGTWNKGFILFIKNSVIISWKTVQRTLWIKLNIFNKLALKPNSISQTCLGILNFCHLKMTSLRLKETYIRPIHPPPVHGSNFEFHVQKLIPIRSTEMTQVRPLIQTTNLLFSTQSMYSVSRCSRHGLKCLQLRRNF